MLAIDKISIVHFQRANINVLMMTDLHYKSNEDTLNLLLSKDRILVFLNIRNSIHRMRVLCLINF